jgi:branched-chain amino acid transport system ATP-binding protein
MGITRTFQTPKPFGNLSVYENVFTIALQTRSYSDADAKTCEVLEKTGLISYRNFLSAKLPIEKRKFLDMARVLTLDPKLIMMDEVMGGLNPSEMDESFAMVKKLNSDGITILFIEHVMRAVVNVCTRLVVLTNGQVLCTGAPMEVLKRQDVIEAYLGESKNHADHK